MVDIITSSDGRNIMKTSLKLLIIVGIIFQLLSSQVYGGVRERITKNQLRAKEYILQLKNGADPDKLKRPYLRRHNKWKVKKSRREIKRAMDRAEALARAGKRRFIRIPDYVYKGMSEKKYTALQERRNKRNR